MRLFRGALVSTVTIATLVSVAAAPASAAVPTAPYTVFNVNGAAGNYPLSSGSRLFDNSNSTIDASQYGSNGINMSVSADVGYWGATITPPVGGTLSTGVRYQTRRFADSTHAGFALSGEGRGCNQMAGWIEFAELEWDAATGAPAAFAATYANGCEENPNPMTGELRWKSAVDFAATTQSVNSIAFGGLFLGGDGPLRSVTFTSAGSAGVSLGAATTTNPNFVVGSDGCAGATLAYGESCTVSVRARLIDPGSQQGHLVIPDASGDIEREIFMSAFGQRSAMGSFHPVGPVRLLDTRSGLGAPKGTLGDHQVVNLQVTGRGGVPASGVSAVVLNVTATAPTHEGYVTAYPAGVTRPTASNLNFPAGRTVANSVTVRVGSGGKVALYHRGGASHLIADVVGFYIGTDAGINNTVGGEYHPTVNQRILDTRHPSFGGPLQSGWYVTVGVDYGASNQSIRALAVNVTSVGAKGTGHLTTWSGAGDPPTASTLNFTPGRTVPNLAVVPVAACPWEFACAGLPSISILNGSSASTHVVVDILGFYDDGVAGDGLRFRPIDPVRIADTRIGQGAGSIGPDRQVTIEAPESVATAATEGLALNVTAVKPTESTYLTVWPNLPGYDRPHVSTLNPVKGEVVANATVTGIGPDAGFNIYNYVGRTDVVVDVAGTFDWRPDLNRSAGARTGSTAAVPHSRTAPDHGGYRQWS